MSRPFHILRASARSPVPPERLMQAVLADDVEVRQVFKQGARSRVRWVVAADAQWVVKEMWDVPGRALLSSAVRATPGWRQWSGAERLAAAGLRVSRPVVLAGHGFGSVAGQTLVLPYHDGPAMSRALREAPPPEQFTEARRERRLRLAASLGLQAGRMIRAGYVNRDHKASNLILDAVAEHGGEPLLIDLDGLRRLRGTGRLARGQIERMISTLYRSATDDGVILPEESTAFVEALLQEAPRLREHAPRLAALCGGIEVS